MRMIYFSHYLFSQNVFCHSLLSIDKAYAYNMEQTNLNMHQKRLISIYIDKYLFYIDLIQVENEFFLSWFQYSSLTQRYAEK